MLVAKLVVVGGNAQFDEIDLKLPVVIGRGTDADLVMTDELISRRHAEIIEEKGHLLVRDLGSRNGTFINNSRIEGVSRLEPEQLLTLGTMTFRAIYEIKDRPDSVQMSETVRINFNETEPIHRPSSAEDLKVRYDQHQDDLETVDLDEYVRRQGFDEIPADLASRETAYASKMVNQDVLSRVESDTPRVQSLKSSSDDLQRRFPK